MSSASFPVRQALEGYIAGRVKAERVVVIVTEAYYRETGHGKRDTLRPLIEIIERAHPGVVELSGAREGPGFGVRLAERPFPKEYEGALRQAAQAMLSGHAATTFPVSRVPLPGLVARLVGAIRRLFTAST
jgi:hypothetical protein